MKHDPQEMLEFSLGLIQKRLNQLNEKIDGFQFTPTEGTELQGYTGRLFNIMKTEREATEDLDSETSKMTLQDLEDEVKRLGLETKKSKKSGAP